MDDDDWIKKLTPISAIIFVLLLWLTDISPLICLAVAAGVATFFWAVLKDGPPGGN